MKTKSNELIVFLDRIQAAFNFVKITKKGHLKTDTGLKVLYMLRVIESPTFAKEQPIQVTLHVAYRDRSLTTWGAATNDENGIILSWFKRIESSVRNANADKLSELEKEVKEKLL